VIAPLWLLSGVLDGWREPIAAIHHHTLPLIVGAWTLAVSVIAIKFIPPLLTSLAEPGTAIGPLLPLVWLAGVAASTSVVVVGGLGLILPSVQLSWSGLVTAVIIWLCVEIVGTLAIPAVLHHGVERGGRDSTATHQAPVATEQASPPAARVPHDGKLPPKASASSAMTAEDVLEALHDIRASPWGSYPLSIQMQPGGWIRCTHRELAEYFGIPRANLVRRLDQLKLERAIDVVSTQQGTRIKILSDTSQG
jgi:hypothetical protein